MSADTDLDSFVGSLSNRLDAVRREAVNPSRLPADMVIKALGVVGALDLARDTADLPNALTWLSSVVRSCAGFSPSIAFALGSLYAAQRAAAPADSEMDAVAAVATGDADHGWRATVPLVLEPDSVVLLDRVGRAGWVVPWDSVHEEAPQERTGLKEADLRTVSLTTQVTAMRSLSSEQAVAALFEFDLFSASVAQGVLDRAVLASEEYASGRRQFGTPIAAFAGLAAILVDMRLRAATVASLLAEGLERRREGAELAAVAGRASVETCLEAIQVHGGYGYIDEYPITGLLRDAISLRARGGGRRAAVAAVAAAHLPSA